MPKGDHIRVYRGGYYHHGIDIGDDTVVHFTGEPFKKTEAMIKRTSLIEFLNKDSDYEIVVYPPGVSMHPDQVITTAIHHIGQSGYKLFSNNCEHFACFCKTGVKISTQINDSMKRVIKWSRYGVKNPAMFLAGPAFELIRRGLQLTIHKIEKWYNTTSGNLIYKGSCFRDNYGRIYYEYSGQWSFYDADNHFVMIQMAPYPVFICAYIYVDNAGNHYVQTSEGLFGFDSTHGLMKIA